MKKNFIKKTLASTLAFAMVASVVPVAPASAAKAPALNKTGKVLYLNENEVGSTFNFNVVNQVKGSTYKWASADKTIATVNAKTGVVTAKKVGSVKVTCKITLPTKKTKTLTATVAVKENAVKAAISNPTETVKINEEYNFNKSFTTASGGACTDYQNWVLDTTEGSNTAGATVDAKSGKVTATKAGSFKIKVQAYQNATKLAAGDVVESEWLTVKVAPSIVGVAQTASKKVAVTFDDNMKDVVKATDFVIENKANHVKPAIKSVSFSDDGKVVTIETYAEFTDAATYTLTYKEKATEFTTSIGAVTSLEVTTTTAVFNKATEIKYVLKNANGVDITESKGGDVTIEEVENTNGFYDKSAKKVTIFAKGSVAKFKAVYHTYDYNTDGTEKGSVKTEFTVTGVDETAATFTTCKYTIADTSSVNWNKVTTTKTSLAVGDPTRYINVTAKDSTGTDVTTGYTFESSNKDVLLVDSATGEVTGVKAGSAYVNVKKNDKVVFSCPVTVLAKREATTITLATNSKTVSNAAGIPAEKVEITVNDQHGEAMDASKQTITVESVKAGNPSIVSVVGKNVEIDASAGVAEGTYQYKIKLSDSKLTVITVVVKKPTTATNFQVQLSTQTVDAVVPSDVTLTTSKDVTINLAACDANGTKVNLENFTLEVTKPDGTVDKTTFAKAATTQTFNVLKVTPSASGTTGTAVKVATGTYKVTAYVGGVEKAYQFIKVTDSQSLPSWSCDKEDTGVTYTAATAKADVLSAITAAFTFKDSAGVKLTSFDVDPTGAKAADYYVVTGKSVYVKKVIVKETIGNVVVEHEVTIGKTVNFK
jgi:hypothetical protein